MLIVTTLPASAASLLFAADGQSSGSGSLEGSLPLKKLGGLSLPRGHVAIHGNQIEITIIPEWQFSRQVVLRGSVLDSDAAVKEGVVTAHGVAFFTDGDWLQYLDNRSNRETVVTKAGSSLVGRIVGVDDNALSFEDLTGKSSNVELTSVSDLRSPRAYKFTITGSLTGSTGGTGGSETNGTGGSDVGTGGSDTNGTVGSGTGRQLLQIETSTADFSTTGSPFHVAALQHLLRKQENEGDIPTSRLVVMGTLFSLAQLGQLAPVIAVPAGAGGIRRTALRKELEFANSVSGTLGGP
jgi:hypothetical protein